MDFRLAEEQTQLADALRRYLDRNYRFEQRRAIAAAAPGFSIEAWRQYAEFGLLGLTLAEADGGLAGGAVDTMVVMQEFGRALVLEPYLASSVLAAPLLAELGSAEQRARWLPAVARGERRLALAHGEAEARYVLEYVATRARRDGAGWLLTGAKSVVLGGADADALLVSARTEGEPGDARGVSLFLVEPAAAGLRRRGYRMHDLLGAAEIELAAVAVPAQGLLGPAGQALPALARAVDRAGAALCAEAVGAMDALNAATVEYLKTRRQFGQPLGRFQVLQHRMVDMFIATEQARSMMYHAATRADHPDALERGRAVAAARTLVDQSARLVGQQAVQLHGGMGVTDELAVSHWFKRLTTIGLTLGDVDHHRARYGDLAALAA